MCGKSSSDEICAKITDFGTSKYFTGVPIRGRFVDNPTWLAPEILRGEPYGLKVDIYAYGVILWEILTRKDYFGECTFLNDIESSILTAERPEIIECPSQYSEVISKCWSSESDSRPELDWVIGLLHSIDDIEKYDDFRKIRYQSLVEEKITQEKLKEEQRERERQSQSAISLSSLTQETTSDTEVTSITPSPRKPTSILRGRSALPLSSAKKKYNRKSPRIAIQIEKKSRKRVETKVTFGSNSPPTSEHIFKENESFQQVLNQSLELFKSQRIGFESERQWGHISPSRIIDPKQRSPLLRSISTLGNSRTRPSMSSDPSLERLDEDMFFNSTGIIVRERSGSKERNAL